jgi:hypothetical protein
MADRQARRYLSIVTSGKGVFRRKYNDDPCKLVRLGCHAE